MHSIRVRSESSMGIAVFYLLYHIELLEKGMNVLKGFKMISGRGPNTKGVQPIYCALIMWYKIIVNPRLNISKLYRHFFKITKQREYSLLPYLSSPPFWRAVHWFLEKRKGEERNIDVRAWHWPAASCTPPTSDQAVNSSMCPDWESTQKLFGDGMTPSRVTLARAFSYFVCFRNVNYLLCIKIQE